MTGILIFGVNSVTAKYIPNSLKEVGLTPTFLLDPVNFEGEAQISLRSCACYPVDVSNSQAVLQFLRENRDIVRQTQFVMTFFDELFPLVELICETFDLSGPPPVFAKLSDKASVASIVPEYCPQSVSFNLGNLSDCQDLSRMEGVQDFILKPVLSSGAVGAERLHIDVRNGLSESLSRAVLKSGLPGAAEIDWLLQEHVSGTLYSLEGFVEDGCPVFLGFSQRTRIEFTEVTNRFPADDQMPAHLRQRCKDCVQTIIDRSGFANGYFHCEFILTDAGAWLIDANLGRIGGPGIVEQIAIANRVTPGDILNHVVLLALGEKPERPHYVSREHAMETKGIWYGLKEGGIVRGWDMPETFSSTHTPCVRPGDHIRPVGSSDYAWVGVITGRSDAVTRDARRVRVLTDNGPQAAFFDDVSRST